MSYFNPLNQLATYIIAEAGVNHNGDLETAYQLVDIAKTAGADCVKFQTFKAENLATKQAPKAKYQETSTQESQYDMLKRLMLSETQFQQLRDYAEQQKITFLSTAFDHDSLHFLTHTLGLTTLKIGSGELTNAPLLLAYARTKAQLILSTGMGTLSDIEQALSVIAFGLLSGREKPSRAAFREAYISNEGQAILQKHVSLLHCTSVYPAAMADLNLRVIQSLGTAFGLRTGYSDHSEGIHVPIAAVTMGACIIEKHFTCDKNMAGPDHKTSLAPNELQQMIRHIRDIEKALGGFIKFPSINEQEIAKIARKSLVANKKIQRGDVYSEANLTVKRPGTGLSPIYYWDFINTKATCDYQIDDLIDT